MMPSATLVSITTYVPPEKKARVEGAKKVDRRLTASKVLEDLIDLYWDDYAKKHLHPTGQSRKSPQ